MRTHGDGGRRPIGVQSEMRLDLVDGRGPVDLLLSGSVPPLDRRRPAVQRQAPEARPLRSRRPAAAVAVAGRAELVGAAEHPRRRTWSGRDRP